MSICIEGFRSIFISQISSDLSKSDYNMSLDKWRQYKQLLLVPMICLCVYYTVTISWAFKSWPWDLLSSQSLKDYLMVSMVFYAISAQLETLAELDACYAKATGKSRSVMFCESLSLIFQAVVQLFGSFFLNVSDKSHRPLLIFAVAKIFQSFSYLLMIKSISVIQLDSLSLEKEKEPVASVWPFLIKAIKQCRRSLISAITGNSDPLLISFILGKSNISPENTSKILGSYSIATQYGGIPSRLVHVPISEAFKQTALVRQHSISELPKKIYIGIFSRIRLAIYWGLSIIVFGGVFKGHLLAILLKNSSSDLESLRQSSHYLGFVLFHLAFSSILIPLETELSADVFKNRKDIGVYLQIFDIICSIFSILSAFCISELFPPVVRVLLGSIIGIFIRIGLFMKLFLSLHQYSIPFSTAIPRLKVLIIFVSVWGMLQFWDVQKDPFLSPFYFLFTDCLFGGLLYIFTIIGV